ncbi:MAG: SH3 domain-containing protein [Saprospiraceae bacterium]|nr:SH3 domain-containing protein [Saprospiraceae bacterium]
MPRFIILTFLVLIYACGSSPDENLDGRDSEKPSSPDTTLYVVKVDNLRLRSDSSLTSATVTMLAEGSIVQYWGDQSSQHFQVNLRGSEIDGNWFRVSLGNQTGWVFSGAIEQAENSEDFQHLIIPGERVGRILAADSEQSVIDKLGSENVSRRTVPLGEGESIEATVVYPSSPRELLLLWEQQDYVNLAEIRFEHPRSPWKTSQGLAIGSSLRQIENLNGESFLISGFGWDYGGTTLDWRRGAISESVVLIFEEPERVHSTLVGDHAVSSNDKHLSRSNPKVKQMRILF